MYHGGREYHFTHLVGVLAVRPVHYAHPIGSRVLWIARGDGGYHSSLAAEIKNRTEGRLIWGRPK